MTSEFERAMVLIGRLDMIARDHQADDYGLPLLDNDSVEKMVEAVEAFVAERQAKIDEIIEAAFETEDAGGFCLWVQSLKEKL